MAKRPRDERHSATTGNRRGTLAGAAGPVYRKARAVGGGCGLGAFGRVHRGAGPTGGGDALRQGGGPARPAGPALRPALAHRESRKVKGAPAPTVGGGRWPAGWSAWANPASGLAVHHWRSEHHQSESGCPVLGRGSRRLSVSDRGSRPGVGRGGGGGNGPPRRPSRR